MSDNLLKVSALQKIYRQADADLHVLQDIDMSISSGEIVALVGPSGSGKSTLLQQVGLLDTPTSGHIVLEDTDVALLSDRKRTALRGKFIGFVYQFHYLQPEFTALENVMMPQMILGVHRKKAQEKASSLLSDMGLAHRMEHQPGQLSGGEQQRVAIARALANDARLLLADEPTGNLDPETSEEVFSILLDRVRNAGIGALIATHNMELADRMDRILELRQGRLFSY